MKNILNDTRTIVNATKKNINQPIKKSYKLQMQLTNLLTHLAKKNYSQSIKKVQQLLGKNHPEVVKSMKSTNSIFQAKIILSKFIWSISDHACDTYDAMTDLEKQSLQHISQKNK